MISDADTNGGLAAALGGFAATLFGIVAHRRTTELANQRVAESEMRNSELEMVHSSFCNAFPSKEFDEEGWS